MGADYNEGNSYPAGVSLDKHIDLECWADRLGQSLVWTKGGFVSLSSKGAIGTRSGGSVNAGAGDGIGSRGYARRPFTTGEMERSECGLYQRADWWRNSKRIHGFNASSVGNQASP